MTSKRSSQTTKGYLIAFLGTIIWSTTAILIRYLTNDLKMPPIILAFWRDLIVALVIGVLILVFQRRLFTIDRRSTGFFLAYGLILAVFNTTWTLSVYFNGAAVSTVLAYSSAGFTAILGWKLLKEKLDWAKGFAVLCSLGGCVLVSGALDLSMWKLNPLGIITGLTSGLAFAGYSLMGRYAAKKNIPSATSMFYTFGFAAVFLFFFNAIRLPGYSGWQDLFWLADNATGWGILILLAAVPTIGGYGLYTISLNYLPASVANLIATLEPGFTAVQAYFFLGERMAGIQIAGSILILFGVLFLRWYENRTMTNPLQV